MVYWIHCSAPFFFFFLHYVFIFLPVPLNLITDELVFNHATLFLPLFYAIQFNNPCSYKSTERNMYKIYEIFIKAGYLWSKENLKKKYNDTG